MANLTMTLTSLTPRASKNISAGQATRMLAAFRVIYGKKTDAQGVQTDRTDQELFDYVADVYFQRMREDVRNIENDVARSSVVSIDL